MRKMATMRRPAASTRPGSWRRGWAAAGLITLLAAAGVPDAWSRTPLPTRLVALFLQREHALNDAMAKGDLLAIDELVSRDFEAHAGQAPERPVPRANWLQGSAASQFPGRIEELSARAVGSAALVSFVWVLPAQAGRVSVVDLWDGIDENAHLLVRYASPLGKTTLLQGEPEPELQHRE